MAQPNPLETLSNINSTDLSDPAVQKLYNNLVDGFLVGAKQRKRKARDENSDSNKGYCDYGRHFTRVGTPYTKVNVLVEHGVVHELADSDDDEPSSTLKYDS